MLSRRAVSIESVAGDRPPLRPDLSAVCAAGIWLGGNAGAGRKPGSVVDNHSSGTAVADCLKQPTRESARDRRWSKHCNTPIGGVALRPYSPIWSCSGRGLPCHELLPVARCALTAPFHPYRPRSAVYFLWHFPWTHAPQVLPGALSEGARTFLHNQCVTKSYSDCQAHSGISGREVYSFLSASIRA